MHRIELLVLFFFAIFVGCSSADDTQEPEPPKLQYGLIKNNKLTVSEVERDYILYVPENQNNSAIAILLHGKSDTAEGLLGVSDANRNTPYRPWLDIAEQNNIILIVPNGTLDDSDVQGWNDCRGDGSGNPNIDDVAFIREVLRTTKETYSVDDSRIYVQGTSNGGHLALRLTQEMPMEITAAAAIIAAMPAASECEDADDPVSVLFMNGTEDPIMPYEGGGMSFNRGTVLSTDESVAYWISRNETETNASETFLPDLDDGDNSTVVVSTYANGRNGTEVVLYSIVNGGHTEPSKQERYNGLFTLFTGNQNADIEMAVEVWSFFRNKSK